MSWTSDDYKKYYEERAAIYEFDGGLSREEAERRAEIDRSKLVEKHLEAMSRKGKNGII